MVDSGTTITQKLLPSSLGPQETVSCPDMTLTLDELEKRAVARALERFGSTAQGKQQAAEALGIGQATLYRKIKKYGLENRVQGGHLEAE